MSLEYHRKQKQHFIKMFFFSEMNVRTFPSTLNPSVLYLTFSAHELPEHFFEEIRAIRKNIIFSPPHKSAFISTHILGLGSVQVEDLELRPPRLPL